jgi:hypothetical protein
MKISTVKNLKVAFMAITGLALIGYFALGEWAEHRSDTSKAVALEKYRQTLQPIEVPKTMAELPDLRGQGYVRDLLQAAVLDDQLRGLLEQYVAAPQKGSRDELIEPILLAWVNTSKRRPSIEHVLEQAQVSLPITLQISGPEDARVQDLLQKVFILEVITGSQFFTFQNFDEDTSGRRGEVKLKVGAVSRDVEVQLDAQGYALPARSLNLLPQQTKFVEKAYIALVGSLDKSLLHGRYRYCLANPLDGFEGMNIQKLCKIEYVMSSDASK